MSVTTVSLSVSACVSDSRSLAVSACVSDHRSLAVSACVSDNSVTVCECLC